MALQGVLDLSRGRKWIFVGRRTREIYRGSSIINVGGLLMVDPALVSFYVFLQKIVAETRTAEFDN